MYPDPDPGCPKIYGSGSPTLLDACYSVADPVDPDPDPQHWLVDDVFLSKEELASVSSDGLVSGLLLGSCQLTARALGKTPAGELIEYSRDTVDVHVVYLTSIRYNLLAGSCCLPGC